MDVNLVCGVFIICIIGVSAESPSKVFIPEGDQSGRLAEIDAYLLRHGKEISSGENIEPLLKEVKKIAQRLTDNDELADFYLHVLLLIKEEGSPKVINSERERLNVIISDSPDDDGGKQAREDALQRRNILDAFVDAAAEHVLSDLNLSGFIHQAPPLVNENEAHFKYSSDAQNIKSTKSNKAKTFKHSEM